MTKRITFNASKNSIIESIDNYVESKRRLQVKTSRSDVISSLLEITVPFLEIVTDLNKVTKKIESSLPNILNDFIQQKQDIKIRNERIEKTHRNMFFSSVCSKIFIVTVDYKNKDDSDINKFIGRGLKDKKYHVDNILLFKSKTDNNSYTFNIFILNEIINYSYGYDEMVKIKTDDIIIDGIDKTVETIKKEPENLICWIPICNCNGLTYLLPVKKKIENESKKRFPIITVIE